MATGPAWSAYHLICAVKNTDDRDGRCVVHRPRFPMLSSPNLSGPLLSSTTIKVAGVSITSSSGSFLRSACPTFDNRPNRRVALLDHGRLPKSSANCQWSQVPTSRRPNFILGVVQPVT